MERAPTVWSALRRGVGRRIFLMFMLAALVPILFTGCIALLELQRTANDHAHETLRASAKEYGLEVLHRLRQARDDAGQVLIAIERGEAGGDALGYLTRRFDAAWRWDAAGNVQSIKGIAPAPESLAGTARLPGLQLDESGRPLLIFELADARGFAAFRLTAAASWGERQLLPYNTEFCVRAGTALLNCTMSVQPGDDFLAAAGQLDVMAGEVTEIALSGVAHFAAGWQLYLGVDFSSGPLDLLALQPAATALGEGAGFWRIFVPSILFVLLLVAFMSLHAVAHSLVPLRNLTTAARQVANGDFATRVRVRTGDEFESLADAFNDMAGRIGQQVATLEAMSGIDKLILTGTKLEEVATDVVSHLFTLTHCDAAGVISRDSDSTDMAHLFSADDGERYHDRIALPGDVGNAWCQPQQVALDAVDPIHAPYARRFRNLGVSYVTLIPVILNGALKGVLLLGHRKQAGLSPSRLQRCIDLAGRFAVALSSVEREEALYRQAHFDQLTGLPNRQLMKDRLSRDLAAARLDEHSGALLFLDLDRFKEINDVFGHTVGDAVLSQASQRIVSELRDVDTVARIGGDEFVVILPNVTSEGALRAMAQRLLDALRESFTVRDIDHYLSASIGIAMFPDDGATVETLLKNADDAMYRAKDAGRNRFEFFSRRLNAESRRKIGIERDLRAAFRDGDLEIYYQPQYEIAANEINGAEALLRWQHPQRGAVSPAEFVPLAEDSSLIVDIGAWVIDRACKDLRRLLDMGLHPGPMSINVSARQLAHTGFFDTVLGTAHRHGVHPGYLQLEITESTVAQNRDSAIAVLQSLRNAGVRIALDDFGTGYSSLSYLQQMPFDAIKIDKTFVDRIGSGPTSDNICRTIIRMAEELGKKSIAEGVETSEQVEFLRSNDCDIIQGYYYSRPLPQADFIEFLCKQDFHTRRRKALEVV